MIPLKYFSICVLLLTVILAAGCRPSGQGGEASQGDAKQGKDLFEKTTIGASVAPGCITCHSLDPDLVLVGPSLSGIASRAGSTMQGKSAEEYLHESIVAPNSYIVDGFTEGVMYQNYAKDLSVQEINDIVAYLLTVND